MANGEQISYLIEHGMTSEEIHKHLSDGISMEELYEAAKRCVADGLPITDAVEMEPGEYQTKEDFNNFLSCFKPLTNYHEEEAKWLIPGWIPEGQITLMAADGGVGKTSTWITLVAALSSGERCFLDPIGYQRNPQKVLFMTTEDSVTKKLRKKLRLAGANMENIITPQFSGDKARLMKEMKFGSASMDGVLRYLHPDLCVFDPVQGFVPPEINMGSRNAMRDCMSPLISLGEEVGTASLVICHTNKRKGASGRDRISDSSDLWDISRSVIMMGMTDDPEIRYLSNEKNNYDQLQETILVKIDGSGQPQKVGTTWKRDRDYQIDRLSPASNGRHKKDEIKEWIFSELALAGGKIKTKELDEKASAVGYSVKTYKEAKTEMKNEGLIDFVATGSARKGDREWYTIIPTGSMDKMDILPDDTPVPFDEV